MAEITTETIHELCVFDTKRYDRVKVMCALDTCHFSEMIYSGTSVHELYAMSVDHQTAMGLGYNDEQAEKYMDRAKKERYTHG